MIRKSAEGLPEGFRPAWFGSTSAPMPFPQTSLRCGLIALLWCCPSTVPCQDAGERRLHPESHERGDEPGTDRRSLPLYLAASSNADMDERAAEEAAPDAHASEAAESGAIQPAPPSGAGDDPSFRESATRLLRGMRTGDGLSRSVPSGLPYQSLTTTDKARMQLLSTFQPETLMRVAVTAGIATARDTPQEWPQTVNAYQWRVADRIGQRLVYKQVQFTVGSVLLGEDPRYFQSEDRGAWGRVRNAFKQTWVTRRDNGQWAPAYGTFAGAYAASMVSSRWQPESRREWDEMLRRGSMQIAFQFGNNLAREFLPDVRKWFTRLRGQPAQPRFADERAASR